MSGRIIYIVTYTSASSATQAGIHLVKRSEKGFGIEAVFLGEPGVKLYSRASLYCRYNTLLTTNAGLIVFGIILSIGKTLLQKERIPFLDIGVLQQPRYPFCVYLRVNNVKPYNVIIVDDCVEFARGLKILLESYKQYKVIDLLNDGIEVINHSQLWEVDLILMDVNMPLLNGIKAGKQVNNLYPGIKMVAITLNKEQVYLEELIRAGYKGFVDKHTIVEDLQGVLTTVVNDSYAFPKDIMLNINK